MALLPLSVLIFCALESFIIAESASSSSELPKRYTTLLLQSSNDPNFTLSTETETDLQGVNANHENASWQSIAFEVTNISTLLTNYKSLSFPPLNNSRLFTSENPASLTVVIKNFSGFLLSFNFSYYIGNNNEITNTQSATASLPYKTSSVEESEKYRNEKESKKLAMAIVAEPVTKLLTTSIVNAMKQNLILATKQQQQANQQQQQANQQQQQANQQQQTSSSTTSTPKTSSQPASESSTMTNMVHPTLESNQTMTSEPMVLNVTVDSQNSANNAPIEVASMLLNNRKPESTVEPEVTAIAADEKNSLKLLPTSTDKIETLSHSTESSNDNISLNLDTAIETTTDSISEPQLPEAEPKTMTQDVARKKRSVNTDDSGVVTVPNDKTAIETLHVGDAVQEFNGSEVKSVVAANVNEQTQTDNTKEKASIASEDSMPSLPEHLDAIIKTAAAVVAAAATSGQITKTGPIISDDAHMADNLNRNSAAADEQETSGTAPIKETDSTSSSSSATAGKPENTIRKTHSHHRHKSKNNVASEHSLDSNHHHHDERNRKTKKADNAERGENDGVVGSNDEGDGSSSSSSEEDAEHGGVKKISYKTWRASLEKRNRPPGLFVTVNDNIIFDNWEGIWDKPNVLGKWTGGLKSASKTKWNQSYVSTHWEDATEHDVKITFEWEPIHENAFVILSDIIVSTIALPMPICSVPVKPDIIDKKDDDVKIETTEKSEQKESPTLKTILMDTPLNGTIAADANVVETDASTTHNSKEHVEGNERERQVLKIMRKIGNDETEAERIAHEIMQNLTAKESDDVSLESVLRKLPYNVKEALLLHAQRVLNEGSNELSSTPSTSTSSDATTTPSTTQSTTTPSTTVSSTTPSTTVPSTTPSTTTPSTTLSTTPSTTTPSTTPSTTTPSTTSIPSTTESPTTTKQTRSSGSSILRESVKVEPVQSTANKRPARKTDNLTALGVCIFTGVVFAGLLSSVVWKKVQLQRKGRNATR